MHGFDIMYTDPFDREHQYPERFDVMHQGDFSGDVIINMEAWHVEEVAKARSPEARHGNAIVEAKIPFEVLAQIVAEYLKNKRISRMQEAAWRDILG
jgi:hypothetical protein